MTLDRRSAECPFCGHDLEGHNRFCPECGLAVAVTPPKSASVDGAGFAEDDDRTRSVADLRAAQRPPLEPVPPPSALPPTAPPSTLAPPAVVPPAVVPPVLPSPSPTLTDGGRAFPLSVPPAWPPQELPGQPQMQTPSAVPLPGLGYESGSAPRERFTALGAMSILFGLLVFGGLVLPFVQVGGEATQIWDGGQASVTFSIVGFLSVAGGIAARAGHRAGFALAGGMALAFIGFAGVAMRIISLFMELGNAFGGDASFHIGAVMWVVAGILGVALFVGTVRGVSAQWGEANPLAVIGVVLGAGTFTWGIVQPAVKGASIWDNLFASDDMWMNLCVAVIVGAVPLSALVVLMSRSRASLMLPGGSAIFWLSVWFSQSQDFAMSQQGFVDFLDGQFAAVTIGLGLMLLACLAGGLVPEQAPNSHGMTNGPAVLPGDRGAYRSLQLVGLGVAALVLIAGLAGHEDSSSIDPYAVSDPYGSSDYSSDSFSDDSYSDDDVDLGDLPYDSRFTPMAESCAAGDMSSCNSLFWATPVGSDFETFGATCGNRSTRMGGNC